MSRMHTAAGRNIKYDGHNAHRRRSAMWSQDRFNGLVVGAVIVFGLSVLATAQAPARGEAAAQGAGPASSRVESNLAQLMRGIVYPSSNVVFAAQSDMNAIKAAADPSVSPNLLTSTYGGWQAVENAALAIAESANLIMVPGRLCSNGKPVPIQRADFQSFANGLRDAGRAAYKAAQSKNQDNIVDAS